MQTYKLASAAWIHAPGTIAWAINGYAFEDDRPTLLKILMDGWNIPEEAAKALLSKAVPYTVEGETVVFKA
jgi:hypothetical protein